MWAVESLSICTLMGLLSESYKVSAEKVEKSYLSWDWRVMQSAESRTDLWFQMWHEEFGEFLPNHSKVWKFHFDGLFFFEVYEVWKIWLIWLIFMRAVESLKICTLMGSFCLKNMKFSMKKYRRVTSRDTEEWCKAWRRANSWFQKWHEEFREF